MNTDTMLSPSSKPMASTHEITPQHMRSWGAKCFKNGKTREACKPILDKYEITDEDLRKEFFEGYDDAEVDAIPDVSETKTQEKDDDRRVWTPERIEELRQYLKDAFTRRDIAAHFGVTESTICQTIRKYLPEYIRGTTAVPSAELIRMIDDTIAAHPTWAANRISDHIRARGSHYSKSTISRHLIARHPDKADFKAPIKAQLPDIFKMLHAKKTVPEISAALGVARVTISKAHTLYKYNQKRQKELMIKRTVNKTDTQPTLVTPTTPVASDTPRPDLFTRTKELRDATPEATNCSISKILHNEGYQGSPNDIYHKINRLFPDGYSFSDQILKMLPKIYKDLDEGTLYKKQITEKYGIGHATMTRIINKYKNDRRNGNTPVIETPMTKPTPQKITPTSTPNDIRGDVLGKIFICKGHGMAPNVIAHVLGIPKDQVEQHLGA